MMSEEVTRNASGRSGDDVDEMTRRPRLADRSADALFSGRIPVGSEDHGDVAAFSEALRAAVSATPMPVPNAALTAVLAAGLSTDNGDLPETVGSNAPAPATQGSGLPKRRGKTKMLELLIAKLAGISLLAKTSVAGAAVLAGATGAGLTGNLPDQVQEPFDRAFAEAPAEPTEDDTTVVSQETADGDLELVDDELEGDELEGDELEGDELDGPDDGFGARVADDATGESDGEHGVDGSQIADEASEGRSNDLPAEAEEGRQIAEANRTQARANADEAAGNAEAGGTEARANADDAADNAEAGRTEAGNNAADQADSKISDDVPAGSVQDQNAAGRSAPEDTPRGDEGQDNGSANDGSRG
jgi:hypothetical protein